MSEKEYAATVITIRHKPRTQKIVVTRPSGNVEFECEAPPSTALKTLASWLERWADR